MADLQAFLESAGWSGAVCEPITGDASPRRYFRLRKEGHSAILMDASRALDSVAPFIRVGEHLHQLGFSAPEIFFCNKTAGFLLLEDFGDATFARLLDGAPASGAARFEKPPLRSGSETGARDKLFAIATDVLVALHQLPQAAPANLRPYSPEQMLADLELFLEWCTPNISDAAKAEFRNIWQMVLPLAHRVPESLLLRDYHIANLMLLPDRDGVRRAGLLDFQDAYRGPVTYDLISLLEDARRDVPDRLREQMLSRYAAQFPSLDKNHFETSLVVVAALRHMRVLAIFERLARRDGKEEYRKSHSPRVEHLLQRALLHPALGNLKNWMHRHARTD